ncbi:MAG: hypothetical protein ACR2IH_09165 [Pyrinomonadaceae bacterium]
MNIAAQIRTRLGDEWLPEIYSTKVRSDRTRSYSLDIPQRENQAEIFHTLLGIELKVGKNRLACPDLSTARYLRVFARMGCTEIALPYDISRIPAIADELETAWHKTLLFCSEAVAGSAETLKKRLRGRLLRMIREEITTIGAGEAMPQFRKATSQRS